MKVGILIGSVRKGRISDRMAKWINLELKKQEGVETTIIDLVDYPLPLFDEAVSPQYNPDRKPEGVVAKFLDAVGSQDGLVVITPEYNRSYSAAVKNALDYIDFQLKRKPVLLAAHGSTGGAQAVSHLRAVFPGLLAVTSPVAVMVNGWLSEVIKEDGQLNQDSPMAKVIPANLDRALEEFLWLTKTLNDGRSKDK